MFGYKGGNYSIKVSFGTFSISLENGNRIPEPVPVRRRKRPFAIKRDKNRRIEFLKNKNSTSSCPFSSGVNTVEETRVLDLQSSVTLPSDENPQTNAEQQESPCVCQVIPCVCLASQPVSSQNQTEFRNLATQQISHHLIYHFVPAATFLSKTTNTSALLLVIKPLKNNMRVLVINAWMKIY